MTSPQDDDKVTFMTCMELVLMKRGNADYILIRARLDALYACEIGDCIDHPEYLREVLREVYEKEYGSVLDEISLETDRLVGMDQFKHNFFKVMKG